jgi:hypothetical protein
MHRLSAHGSSSLRAPAHITAESRNTMPSQTKNLMNFAIGNITDRYCDNEARTIGHLVVETGSFECDR